MMIMVEVAYASQHWYQSLCVNTNAEQINFFSSIPRCGGGFFLPWIDHVCSRSNDRDSPRLMD